MNSARLREHADGWRRIIRLSGVELLPGFDSLPAI